jgi:anti-sigma factor RsiW
MTTPGYSKDDLTGYLLGSLPQAETERFDELSVSDKEFADELSAVEMDLVDAYVQGELPREIVTRFDDHYLATPLRRDKVELARAIQAYGAEAIEPDVIAAKPGPHSVGFLGWLGSLTSQNKPLRWSLAVAAAVLLTAAGWWIFRGGGTPAVASFVLAPALRGNDQITTLSFASRTSELRLQLQLEADDYPTYQVTLKVDASVSEVWRSETLRATSKGEDKVLEVRIPARLFQSRIYSLVVSGIGRDGTIELVSDYPFRAEIK